jgi:hypothetical protein
MLTTTCYLLHFAEPIGNPANPVGQAQHYTGSTADLVAELARLAGPGCHAKIMREVNRQGISWQLARTWPGDRKRERRIKDMGGARRHCPLCGAIPSWYMRGDVMIGGYSMVAALLSRQFEASIDRRQVAAWYNRATRNQDGQLPPQPAQKLLKPPRTTPRYLFDTDDWVTWLRPGVPGPRNKGWRVYPERTGTSQPQPQRTGRPSSARLVAASMQPAGE